MSVAIPQGNLITLLNAQEQREVNAVANYPRRKLNDLERAIKQLAHVLTVGRGLANPSDDVLVSGNAMESMDTSAILDRLDRATSMTTVRLLAREAITSPLALGRLVGMYPYVEFEDAINGRLNVFQQMVLRGVKVGVIVEAALWLHNFKNLCLKIPTVGSNNWFIGTPDTPYALMRLAAKEQPEAVGLVLPNKLQASFDDLFRDNGKHNHPLQLIREYNLHEYRWFLSRFGLTEPSEVDAVEERVDTVNVTIGDYRIGNKSLPTLSVTVANYPILGIDEIRVYRFVL